jgi:hypothetical protein
MNPQHMQMYDSNEQFSYRERHAHRHDVLERLILIASNGLVAILGLRFVFALLDANPSNGFAAFVYGLSTPFVTPFYSLFSYDHPAIGAVRFEGYTLIAIAVYGLLGAGLVRLISVTRYS